MTLEERAMLAGRLAHEILSSGDDFVDRFVVMAMTIQAYIHFESDWTPENALDILEKLNRGVREGLSVPEFRLVEASTVEDT